jgi:two-component system, OmpR family, sensor kinase ParS
MGKLFLKLWILLLATSYASYRIQVAVFDWTMEHTQYEWPRTPFLTTTTETVAWALRDVPVADWPARFGEIGPKLSFPSELVPLSTLLQRYPIEKANLPKLESGKNVYTSTGEGQPKLGMKRVAPSDLVLVISLPPEEPMLIFGLMSSTKFTWLTESLMYASAVLLWLSLFWRDLAKLIRASDRIGNGDFSFAAKVRTGSALRPLTNSLSRMTERIAALVNSHKALTNAISHEFRTPITRLRFRHELAINAVTLAEKNRELDQMNSAIDQLDDLSTELLEYARLDREDPRLDKAAIDTEPWLNELAEEAREIARATGRQVQVDVHADVDSIEGDYRYLSRAVTNLLGNATRYATRQVSLQVEMRDGKTWLHVDDDGPGIPASEREHLFEPFTRLDKSRDRQSGGFGIGLAIVKQIARWHGGTAEIAESKLGGTRVSLRW